MFILFLQKIDKFHHFVKNQIRTNRKVFQKNQKISFIIFCLETQRNFAK